MLLHFGVTWPLFKSKAAFPHYDVLFTVYQTI